jgi:phosphosulfolactate synthase (CoM biosynthesis protein A)
VASVFIQANPRNAETAGVGKRYMTDVPETMGGHVDGPKFAGGPFTPFPEKELHKLIDLAHSHDVCVSADGFMKRLLTRPEVFTIID